MTTGDYPREHYAARLTSECNCALCTLQRDEKAEAEAFWSADEWTPDQLEKLRALKTQLSRRSDFEGLMRMAALKPKARLADSLLPNPIWVACDMGSSDTATYAEPPAEPDEPTLNPKDLVGARKLPLALIPRGALVGVARAMAEGARKYGPFNWRQQPIQAVTYAEAALRHVNEWLDGEDIDPETGDARIHHIDLAIASLLIMRDAQVVGTLRDNRHTPGNFADALRAATRKPDDA